MYSLQCRERQLAQAPITRIMQSTSGLLLGPDGRFLVVSRRLPPSSYRKLDHQESAEFGIRVDLTAEAA